MKLEIIELSQNFVKWRLTDLDPNYSRNDRKIQFTVHRKNENDTGYGFLLHAEIDTRNALTIPTAKNGYGIPMGPKLKSFEHVTYFGITKDANQMIQPHDKLIFNAQVLYSYGPVKRAEVLEDVIGIKENSTEYNFTNYPNFEIGGLEWDKDNTNPSVNNYLLIKQKVLDEVDRKNLQKKILKNKEYYKNKISSVGMSEDTVYKNFEHFLFGAVYSYKYYNYYPGPSPKDIWEKEPEEWNLMPQKNAFQKIASTQYQVGAVLSIAKTPKTEPKDSSGNSENPQPTDIEITDEATKEAVKEEQSVPKIEVKINKTQTVSYDNNFFTPVTTPIDTTGSTQYKALFPPILEPYQPAFVGEAAAQYEILFKLSEYSDYKDVAHIDLRVTLQSDGTSVVNSAVWPDGIIYKRKDTNDIIDYGNGIYGVKINTNKNQDSGNYDLKVGHWQKNTYYKVQARLGTTWTGWNSPEEYAVWRNAQAAAGKFSEWSTIMILRSISAPTARILNNNIFEDKMTSNSQLAELSTTPIFRGVYKHEANGEILDTYKYTLQDYETGAILEQTEWLHYPVYSLADNAIEISHRFKFNMEEDKTYRVLFNVRTVNGYELGDDYIFIAIPSYLSLPGSDFTNDNFTLEFLEQDGETEEEGVIKLILKSLHPKEEGVETPIENLTGNFVISRTKSGENLWEDLDIIQIFKGKIKKTKQEVQTSNKIQTLEVYTDFTVESGVKYEYGIQQINFKDTRSQKIVSESVAVNFEHMFLYANGKQLKLKYNPTIDSFKHTVLATKQDTLGSKYPYINRNGYVYYAEFPFKALISFNSDENGNFITKSTEPAITNSWQRENGKILCNQDTSANFDINNFSTNLTYNNINKERKFREEVEKFLNDGKCKLFRSSTEGNFIVSLMNISFTPEAQLGRMIYSVSGTAYEMAECTIENLKKYSILKTSQYQKVHDTIGVYGQIAGVFDSSMNIVDKIYDEAYTLQDNSLLEEVIQYIEELKIIPYPKVDISNNILLAEAKRYDTTAFIKYEDKNGYNVDNLKQLQTLLNTYDTYVPMNMSFNSNIITLLPDTPYVLTEQKITSSDKIYFQKLREKTYYENTDIYQPVLVDFYAYKTVQESVNKEILGAYIHKGFKQLSGYFYDSTDKSCPYFYGDELISSNLDINYYHSLNVIEIMKEQIYEELRSLYSDNFSIEKRENNFIIHLGDYEAQLNALTNVVIEVPQNMGYTYNNKENIITPQGICIPNIENANQASLTLGHMTYATVTYDYTVAIVKYAEGAVENNAQ